MSEGSYWMRQTTVPTAVDEASGLPEYRRSPQITADHRRWPPQITTDHQIAYF